jgi:CCR4-NOT transcriptional regulation complex NOT5 subunit
MYPEEQKMHELDMRVSLLTKDVELTDRLCSKLSESITKIQELNVNIMQMITLHEQRHEQHEKVETELKTDIKDLHDRIDQVERHISQRIDDLRSDLIQHKKEENGMRVKEVLQEIDKYKFAIVAVAVCLGWIIGNVNLGVLGSLFK